MRSKDGGMINFEWDIPTDDEGNLVLYTHTFASSLKPTKLANEDSVLQAETKITVSQTPNEHIVEREIQTFDAEKSIMASICSSQCICYEHFRIYHITRFITI